MRVPLAPLDLRRRRMVLAPAAALGLAACSTSGNVDLRQHVNFAPPTAQEAQPELRTPQAIAAALRRGGLIVYVRHGRTRYDQIELERTNRNAGRFDLARCDTQRQLSDEGRAELRAVGAQFRLASVSLDRAWTSRYCRAIESAAFFVDGAQAVQDLSGEGDFGIDPSIKPRVQAFLSQRPAPGRNHFMMAHGGIFWLATGNTVQEANAVLLDPSDIRRIVARIGPAEWGAVAQAMAALG